MHTYTTSLRSRSIKETLFYAKQYAEQYGVSRVTNTVRLDDIGIPVYAGIRPDAQFGSLCVSSGKGFTEEEAEVGAYMEALELAFAEPQRNKVQVVEASINEVLNGNQQTDAILDFCPILGKEILLDQKINCVVAEDLYTNKTYLVPAEVVFIPYNVAPKYFGSNSNGLCSGNSIIEASIHGILEVIERDIASFQNVKEEMYTISESSYPERVRKINDRIRKAGHHLVLRYGVNQFSMPFFMGTVIDGENRTPVYINSGYGCHFDKNIAIMRAATEALQTRLNIIHGSRDDLKKIVAPHRNYSMPQIGQSYEEIKEYLLSPESAMNYQNISEFGWSKDSLMDCQEELMTLLKNHGFDFVLRVKFSKEEDPLQILRIIIPKMELFSAEIPKIGKRLQAFTSMSLSSTKQASESIK